MAIYFPNSEISEMVCEAWRITSTFQGDNNFIGGNSMVNWERSDDVYGGGNISSGILSESNGSFTFNSDYYGYYLVTHQSYNYLANNTSRWNEMKLLVSWNSGANWDQHSYATNYIYSNQSSASSGSGCASSIVAATSATRLRFEMSVEHNSTYTYGNTNEQMTGFTIAKISDL